MSLLNRLARLLYGQRLTDHATCYKALLMALWRALDLRAERFELCAEVTAKLGLLGVPIREVAIGYRPRTAAEGKKIGWQDGVAAARAFVRWRFAAVNPAADRGRGTRRNWTFGRKAGRAASGPGW